MGSELPTPWHPFLFVASDRAVAQYSAEIKKVIEATCQVCKEFKANDVGSTLEYLSVHHRLGEVDAIDWLDSTEWSCTLGVDQNTLYRTQEALVVIGQLDKPVEPEGITARL